MADAAAAGGGLTQKAGLEGCFGTIGLCSPAVALNGAASVMVSPDARNVYVASRFSDGVAVFDRAADGTLRQKRAPYGCLSRTRRTGACTKGRELDGAYSLAVSPDGKSVYVVGSGVAVFDRAANGTLRQKRAKRGCVSQTGSGGACAKGRALEGPSSVTVSPDGRSVYVQANGVAVFDRAADGTLTQKRAKAGCVSEDGRAAETGRIGACVDGRALRVPTSVTISPNGKSVYVASASIFSDAVAVFDRAANGTLTQKPRRAGCISENGEAGCVNGSALDGAFAVTVSADGRSAYVASSGSGAVAVFDRAASGALMQKPATAGCISDTGSGGACIDGRALGGAFSVTGSPDSRNVYVT